MFAAIAIGDLFAAGEVAFIMALGALLEDATTNRAKKGLQKLLTLAPTQGRRIRGGKEELVPAEQIQKGDLLRILPGETIPVDGAIVSGETSVDQSIMTGESLPVDKTVGDDVFCGTINRFGSIDITATKVGEDSSLQKLIRMVQDAENKQAPMQRIADRAASWLVPVALLIAILAYVFSGNIVTAVTVLVVFCPCALVLATPTAIMAAIGQATKHGVIIKSGEALEKMGKVDTIAFDKTGTLTYGRLEVSDVRPTSDALTGEDLLTLAASAEGKSEHPLGKAIVAHAKAQSLSLLDSQDFQMDAGKGIAAQIGEKHLLCGSEKYLREHGVPLDDAASTILDQLRTEGKASILVAAEGKCIGVIGLSDILRPEAKDMFSCFTSVALPSSVPVGRFRQTPKRAFRLIGIRSLLLTSRFPRFQCPSRGKGICSRGGASSSGMWRRPCSHRSLCCQPQFRYRHQSEWPEPDISLSLSSSQTSTLTRWYAQKRPPRTKTLYQLVNACPVQS